MYDWQPKKHDAEEINLLSNVKEFHKIVALLFTEQNYSIKVKKTT